LFVPELSTSSGVNKQPPDCAAVSRNLVANRLPPRCKAANRQTYRTLPFAECGLSPRTTGVLIKAGIDTPEQLLSMTPDRIRLIQGIGPMLLKEIERYRATQLK